MTRSTDHDRSGARVPASPTEGFCAYCGLEFGSLVTRRGTVQLRTLRGTWDHCVPWAYARRNDDLLPACDLCNGIKGSKFFSTLDEARDHVRDRWRAKGIVYTGYDVTVFKYPIEWPTEDDLDGALEELMP